LSASKTTKYSDQLIDWLVDAGYTHCFFVAGGNNMHLLDSVRTRMVCVPFVHEVGAAIAVEYFNASRDEGSGRALALVTAVPNYQRANRNRRRLARKPRTTHHRRTGQEQAI